MILVLRNQHPFHFVKAAPADSNSLPYLGGWVSSASEIIGEQELHVFDLFFGNGNRRNEPREQWQLDDLAPVAPAVDLLDKAQGLSQFPSPVTGLLPSSRIGCGSGSHTRSNPLRRAPESAPFVNPVQLRS